MTELKKAVTRRTRHSYNVLYSGARSARPIIVTLLPGDVLEFREFKRRERFVLAVDTAFKYAVRLKVLHDAAEKKRRKKGSL